MKNSGAILILTFFLSLTASAQPQRMTPQERTDQLAKELSLTDEQKARVLEHFTQEQQVFQKLRDESRGDREAMRAAMGKRREESNKKMKAILTEEQYAKYETMRGGMPPGGRGQQPPRGRGQNPGPGKAN
jgi:protein CpxP